MIYQFKPGSHLAGNAQAVGESLSRLEAAGELTPRTVLADARDEASPLHLFFEWSDAKAAEKYRLEQAGHLIRSVTVVMEPSEAQEPVTVRAFVPVSEGQEQRHYVGTARALGDADLRKQVLGQAYAELGAIARKYRELKELSQVVEAIDHVGELLKEGQPH
jgi:hypothetical protein